MRQIRVIRISFLICILLAAIAFCGGFYFGNIDRDSAEMVTQNTTDIYEQYSAAGDEAEAERTASADDSAKNDIIESMTDLSPDVYYLKANGSYLFVYRGSSSDVYFETGIRLSDLPESLQEAAVNGITFDNLEELYGFLENYSS
ncbi:MAG: hypothetical protein LUD14_06725 [Clostridiales bacterium]|nr:hypothetical protein [Clostridiales bacterium]